MTTSNDKTEMPDFVSDEEMETIVLRVCGHSPEPLDREELTRRAGLVHDWVHATRAESALVRLFFDGKIEISVKGDELFFEPSKAELAKK